MRAGICQADIQSTISSFEIFVGSIFEAVQRGDQRADHIFEVTSSIGCSGGDLTILALHTHTDSVAYYTHNFGNPVSELVPDFHAVTGCGPCCLSPGYCCGVIGVGILSADKDLEMVTCYKDSPGDVRFVLTSLGSTLWSIASTERRVEEWCLHACSGVVQGTLGMTTVT